jgi:hypothetical protein
MVPVDPAAGLPSPQASDRSAAGTTKAPWITLYDLTTGRKTAEQPDWQAMVEYLAWRHEKFPDDVRVDERFDDEDDDCVQVVTVEGRDIGILDRFPAPAWFKPKEAAHV